MVNITNNKGNKMKITTEQYKSFNNEFKDLISEFFNIHVEDNTAFYAWYSKKRN